jgi:lysophospholipase L1-like esterase
MNHRLRVATAALAMVVATVLATAAPTSASTRPITLLALGDSYSSGNGAGDNAAGNADHTGCRREPAAAYAGQLVAAETTAGHPMIESMVACTGAATADLVSRAQPSRSGIAAQIAAVKQQQPDLITLTIGGNDLGFSDVIQDCIYRLHHGHLCNQTYLDNPTLQGPAIGPGERTGFNGLADRLTTTLQALHAADPHAQIYVLSYPVLFADRGQWSLLEKLTVCAGVTWSGAQMLNGAAVRIGDTIAATVAHVDPAGSRLHFVDWRPPVITRSFGGAVRRVAFDPKGLCADASASTRTMNGIKAPLDGWSVDDSFHPTRAGYAHAAARLTNALAGYPWP